MTTTRTSSTFEIRSRAAAALARGHEYVFQAQATGERVKIGYVANGGFIRVEARQASGTLLTTATRESAREQSALDLFDGLVTDAARATGPLLDDRLTGYDLGAWHGSHGAIVMAAGVLDRQIEALTRDGQHHDGVADLRRARREIVSMLDDEE
jgi:hypothetical protein